MPKSLRENDISAHKFQIDIHLTKVELCVSFPCRLSIIFQRGNYKKESNITELKDKRIAYFDEMWNITTTLFYDCIKNIYIQKEGIFTLQTMTNRGTKIAGLTKINFAEFANTNNVDKQMILPIGKCVDKNAKLHFRLCIRIIQDIRYISNFQSLEDLNLKASLGNLDIISEEYSNNNSQANNKKTQNKIPCLNITEVNASSMILSRAQSKTQDTQIIDDEKITPNDDYHSIRKSQDFAYWKYQIERHDINRFLGSETTYLNESSNKTRDTLGYQFSFKTLSEFKHFESKAKAIDNLDTDRYNTNTNTNNNTTAVTNNNNTNEMTRFQSSFDLQALNLKTQDLEEQIQIEKREKGILRSRIEKYYKDFDKIKIVLFTMQKDYENARELCEKLKSEKEIQQKKRNADSKFYKDKISSLIKITEELNIDKLTKINLKNLQKIANEILNKVENNEEFGMLKNKTYSKQLQNIVLDVNICNDLIKKISDLENKNRSVQQIIYSNINQENEQMVDFKPNLKSMEHSYSEVQDEITPIRQSDKKQIISDNMNLLTNLSQSRHSEENESNDQERNINEDQFHIIEIKSDKSQSEKSSMLIEYQFYQKMALELQAEIEKLKCDLASKDQAIEDLQRIIEEYKKVNLELKNNLDLEQENQRNLLDESQNAYCQRIDELISEKDDLNKKLEEFTNKLNNTYTDIAEMEAEINNLNHLVSEKVNVINELQRVINHQNRTIDDFKNAQKILASEDRVQNERLLIELKKLEKEKKYLETEFQQNFEKLISLNETIDSLREENKRLIEEKELELKEINDILMTIKEENARYKQERESYKVKVDSQVHLIQLENDKLKKCIDELKAINEKCQCNTTEKIDLKNQNKNLITMLTKCQEDIKKLQVSIFYF